MSPPEAGQGTRKLEDRYDGYEILGPGDDRIGKAGGLFVDEHDGREYVEVQGGLVERARHRLLPSAHGALHGGQRAGEDPRLR